METRLLELFVLFLLAIVAGAVGAFLEHRALSRRLTDLEFRVEEQEGRLLHEVKSRAAARGREAKEKQSRLEEWAAEQQVSPPNATPSSVLPLGDWIKTRMNKAG